MGWGGEFSFNYKEFESGASISPEHMLELKIFRMYPRPDESERLGEGTAISACSASPENAVIYGKISEPLHEYTHIFSALLMINTLDYYYTSW